MRDEEPTLCFSMRSAHASSPFMMMLLAGWGMGILVGKGVNVSQLLPHYRSNKWYCRTWKGRGLR